MMRPLLTYFTLSFIFLFFNNSISAQGEKTTINDDSFTIQAGLELNGSVRDNDIISDLDLAVYWGGFKIINQPKYSSTFTFDVESGDFTYISKPNFIGKDDFSYVFSNTLGFKDTATVTIQVYANLSPTAANDYVSMDLGDGLEFQIMPLNNDKDPDGDLSNATLSIFKKPVHGSVEVSMYGFDVLEYVADPNFIGVDSFKYQLCDAGGSCVTAWVYINITDKYRNYPPNAADDYYECNFRGFDKDASENDFDPNTDDFLAYELVSKKNALSIFETGYNGGWFTYTPAPHFSGKDTITYRVCDNGNPSLCDTAMIIINVLPHKAPAVSPYIATVTFNLAEDIYLGDVVESDLEVNFTLKQEPKNGQLEILDELGHWRYTGFKSNSTDTISYEVCDEIQTCSMGYIYVKISENNAPHSSNLTFEDVKNTPFVDFIEIYDNELNVRHEGINVIKQPLHGNFTLADFKDYESGYYQQKFTYIPNKDFVGVETVSVNVCDTEGLCDTVNIQFYYLETQVTNRF